MVSRGTEKPYVKCIGNSAVDVTGSCYLVRFKKYCLLLDCGLVQGHDIATDYKLNMAQLKKIKSKEIDYIILSHQHMDHAGLIPALYARGCQAHVYIPQGSKQFLKLLWEDSMKIFTQDCQKLNNKGTKASPYYSQEDIDRALDRCIEIGYNTISIAEDIDLTYLPANHILHACQVFLDFKQGSVHHRLGFTGDIGGELTGLYTLDREIMFYCNLLLGECTYNEPKRINKQYDRGKDIEKIKAVVEQSHRVLIPCFSLQRTQDMLTLLYNLWLVEQLPQDIQIYLDSPLAIKFCKLWPWKQPIMDWKNLHLIEEWADSQALMEKNPKGIVISASGFLTGGRIMEWLKCSLPNINNTILFCGYSGENNLASKIRYGDAHVIIDGVEVANNANIIELVSFSSHANYYELLDYYGGQCRFDKLALVHGNMDGKPAFAKTLQEALSEQGKSSRVICTNEDTKIYF